MNEFKIGNTYYIVEPEVLEYIANLLEKNNNLIEQFREYSGRLRELYKVHNKEQAETARLRETLQEFADEKHWGYDDPPGAFWIAGEYYGEEDDKPFLKAQRALAEKGGDTQA